jgi:hypothetical protein
MALQELQLGKACGLDGVRVEALRMLPRRAHDILRAQMSNSLRRGVVPRTWKDAEVVALLKPGKPAADLGSWRPVSLTAVICKFEERIIARRLQRLIDKIVGKEQSGFRHGMQTVDQLVQFIELQKHRRKGEQLSAMLIDFSKAFDTVVHATLLGKLERYRVPYYIRRSIAEWLTGRQICVRVKAGKQTGFKPIRAGVPQGSVLGPLLFLLYVADLQLTLRTLGVHFGLFADDLTVYASGT